MPRPAPSDPKDVITWCLLAGAMALLAGIWKAVGWYRWLCIGNGALFLAGAWTVSRRLPAARWIIVTALLPQLLLTTFWVGPQSWLSWIGFITLFWIGWLALNLPKSSTDEKAR